MLKLKEESAVPPCLPEDGAVGCHIYFCMASFPSQFNTQQNSTLQFFK